MLGLVTVLTHILRTEHVSSASRANAIVVIISLVLTRELSVVLHRMVRLGTASVEKGIGNLGRILAITMEGHLVLFC